jgi:hypothetical protein
MGPYTQEQEDEIVRRRFGPCYEHKCNDPAMIECSRWACQGTAAFRAKKRAALTKGKQG